MVASSIPGKLGPGGSSGIRSCVPFWKVLALLLPFFFAATAAPPPRPKVAPTVSASTPISARRVCLRFTRSPLRSFQASSRSALAIGGPNPLTPIEPIGCAHAWQGPRREWADAAGRRSPSLAALASVAALAPAVDAKKKKVVAR